MTAVTAAAGQGEQEPVLVFAVAVSLEPGRGERSDLLRVPAHEDRVVDLVDAAVVCGEVVLVRAPPEVALDIGQRRDPGALAHALLVAVAVPALSGGRGGGGVEVVGT
ncbi:hypothetical protein [Nocardioides acrostichi]|uniref:Uncharacterized protein n=1 Tax=Nocardioides acrostichi TaxID=2784339 RepID=A0A930V2B3_9ACTN|nr:hypothetical protein [Nocardioides acrostichi]MBF4162586.1 hypothetical protein [Nocardioides acrostichi]